MTKECCDNQWADGDCIVHGPKGGEGEYGIEDIIEELVPLIRDTLIDGQRKRSPSYWKEDPGHLDALQRHLHRYDLGERVDEDSLAHPLQHAGVRCLMQAYQERHAMVDTTDADALL